VQGVEVLLERAEARVCYDPDKLVPPQFEVALFVMGFTLRALSKAESQSASPELASAGQQPPRPRPPDHSETLQDGSRGEPPRHP
jgi:hypothetical protein